MIAIKLNDLFTIYCNNTFIKIFKHVFCRRILDETEMVLNSQLLVSLIWNGVFDALQVG